MYLCMYESLCNAQFVWWARTQTTERQTWRDENSGTRDRWTEGRSAILYIVSLLSVLQSYLLCRGLVRAITQPVTLSALLSGSFVPANQSPQALSAAAAAGGSAAAAVAAAAAGGKGQVDD